MARKFSFRWVKLAAVGALMALPAIPAQAQVICGGHDVLVARLAAGFEENRLGYGVAGQVAIFEVFVSPSGTWTIVMTDVKGQSCILAAGDGWEDTLATAVQQPGG
ncbi:hypothetical protein EN828_02775 [Mesorhizobium sp. M2D.F.Ca.ET.185.01.1.1]|uniref:hypothetical protein n=1 Tax=unclassified Mesorhizobium TaxID=325217 RepID=UPI000FCBF308|nr:MULTISPECIES: hypothetical protein [unclassified Mesorhizobium]TGP83527.1 hypothetical protein EN870_03075 [bacterium M00.F.Ca.ET.227.01.1.1]TGP99482.1 hypothetical protein EN864_06975 [bacterium M00.F.Ca.ET.221.01.1.1]TGQ00211.1 hypothetical protein EN865_06975 [bacterium M00.F.Ca.ET.222.01.1.1]TGT78662.1 hypothetical protein EN802_03235 [bacterium M00.F.Ca.ET.159.01.1.1]TGT89328.1 hypothetical protein EN800_03235 [bacterium M00.F.Ca.ET.157.01.1.1]TGU11598.1 hypothetical protein EN806_234